MKKHIILCFVVACLTHTHTLTHPQDYYVWNPVTTNMQWDKVNDYHSMIEEIKRGIRCVPLEGVYCSVESWSKRISTILKTKGEYIKWKSFHEM